VDVTAVREIEEEAGVLVKLLGLLSPFGYTVKKGDTVRDTVQLTYFAKVSGSTELRLSAEHQAAEWVPVSRLHEYSISDETRNVIREGWDLLQKGV
jgi:8-oxo-dGTP pyrophosphatase MutT (NUDIX family)